MNVSSSATPFVNANQLSMAYTQAVQAASMAEQQLAALLRTDVKRREDQIQEAEVRTQPGEVDGRVAEQPSRQPRRRRAAAQRKPQAAGAKEAGPSAVVPSEGLAPPQPLHRVDVVA